MKPAAPVTKIVLLSKVTVLSAHMYSSIFVNFLIYVHICSSQIVFLSNFHCVITTLG